MLVIKKTISLEFLGEDYKDSTITFKSIPARDLPEIIEASEKLGENVKLLIPFFIQILERYYLEGTHKDGIISKEDIGELDAESIINCFQVLTGQAIDPKDNGPLTNTSSTEASEAQK